MTYLPENTQRDEWQRALFASQRINGKLKASMSENAWTQRAIIMEELWPQMCLVMDWWVDRKIGGSFDAKHLIEASTAGHQRGQPLAAAAAAYPQKQEKAVAKAAATKEAIMIEQLSREHAEHQQPPPATTSKTEATLAKPNSSTKS